MNSAQSRSSMMLVGVASFAVIAAWHVGVRPMSAKAKAQQAAFDIVSTDVAQGLAQMESTPVDPQQLLQTMNVKAEQYRVSFTSTDASTEVYSLFDPLARRAGMTISRLEPTEQQVHIKDGLASVTTSRFVVEGDGTLESVRAFIWLIQHDCGLSIIRSMRIIPVRAVDGEDNQVHLTIRTEHVTIADIFDSKDDQE